MRGEGDSYVTERPYPYTRIEGGRNVPDDRVRVEMLDAFKRIMQAVKRSGLPRRAATLDARRSKKYWSSDVEMAARAFESYVVNKLKAQGYSNDYLANIVSPEYWDAAESLGLEAGNSYPYLLDDEIEAVNEAFDAFFETVRTRETDKGVAMFARKAKPHNMQDGDSILDVPRKPDDWYPHADGRITLFRQGSGNIPSMRVDFRAAGRGGFRIVSVYPMLRRSISKKMNAAKLEKDALSRVGHIPGRTVGSRTPGQLSIADYLSVMGDRSSLPTSSSEDALKAGNSIVQDHDIGKQARKARHVRSESDRSDRATIKAVHVYETPVILEGERYDVYLYVREHTDGHRFYDHYVARKAKPAGISGDSTQATSERRSVQPATGSDENIDEGKRAHKVYATL